MGEGSPRMSIASAEKPFRPALFCDRDGTLIAEVPDPLRGVRACYRPQEVRLLPGVRDLQQFCLDKGWPLVVISNQQDVGRADLSRERFSLVHERFVAELCVPEVCECYFRYCFHLESDGCYCRKPRPGMILEAAQELNLDLQRSYMIGNRLSDVQAGDSAGCRSILLNAIVRRFGSYPVVPDLRGAVELLERLEGAE